MNHAHAHPVRGGFTLLELLVTVSILAILMGLIIPVFSHMKDNARRAMDKVTAKNLETAFRAYLDHYKTWPSSVSSESEKEINGNLYLILRGDKVGNDNSEKIAFYEFSNTNTGNQALNSFSNVFIAEFDHDYNNLIRSTEHGEIYRPVIVWSRDSDGKFITSW